MRLIHAFQMVERVAHAPDLVRHENDTEHSYFLAMMAWYLIDSLHLPLDRAKTLEYALIHDLVEAYAGDTYAFDADAQASKHVREKEAAERIAREFPEVPHLHATIAQYERQEDEESVFVKALDKLLPVLTNYLQDGRTWKAMGVTFEQFLANKRPRCAPDERISDLLEQMIVYFETDRARYFSE